MNEVDELIAGALEIVFDCIDRGDWTAIGFGSKQLKMLKEDCGECVR